MTENKKPQRQHWARRHRILAGVIDRLDRDRRGLSIAQDQEDAPDPSSIGDRRSALSRIPRRPLGHRLTADDSYIVHTNGDTGVSGDARRHRAARRSASLSRATSTQEGEVADAVLRTRSRRRPGAASTCRSCSTRSARRRCRRTTSNRSRMRARDRLGQSRHRLPIEEVNYRTHRKALWSTARSPSSAAWASPINGRTTRRFPRWRDTHGRDARPRRRRRRGRHSTRTGS